MIRCVIVTPLNVFEWDGAPGEAHPEAAIDLMMRAAEYIDGLSGVLVPIEALQVQLMPSATRLLGIIYDPGRPPWQASPAVAEDLYP